MEKQKMEAMGYLEFAINKLLQLRIKAEFEDRQRGKKRYVSKVSAYSDIIKLLKNIKEGKC